MGAFRKGLTSWDRIPRLPAVIAILVGVWVTAIAQAPTPPYALFQQATLTGSGNTINATNIPVVTGTGAVVYVNATMQFNVDTNGNLTLASGFPQISPAPALLTSGFQAGTYVGPSTIASGKAIITVMGPGVTDGGATMWTLSAPSGASASTYPASATWYVGPIASNPYAARITKAGITSTAWSYGIGSGGGPGNNWDTDTLIGVSQVGNTITIASFTYDSGDDYATPLDQITYTLSPTQ